MLSKIFDLFKKIVISAFLLYGYNIIVAPLGLIVPINIITVFFIGVFGLPALLSFITILIIAF